MSFGFNKNGFIATFATIIGLIFFVSCGGGGGGGGGGGTTGLTYSGLTTPATITDTNAEDIAASAYHGGSTTTAFSGIVMSLQEPEPLVNELNRLFFADITMAIEAVVAGIDFESGIEPNLSAAIQSESDYIDGGCGGSAFYSLQVDDQSGDFTGSLRFDDYCEDGTTLNGRTNFSGQINVNTLEFEYFTLSFDSIIGTSGSESVTMDGVIDFSTSGASIVATMNMLVRDDNVHLVFRMQDYQMTLTDYWDYIEIDISGRFYHPDYGYVDLETTTPFEVYFVDDYPTSGVLEVTGEGSTGVRLTAIDETTCQVDADTDGDGNYDNYTSGLIPWAEL
ncbi:MAG: hypothetical protein V2J65_34100 [Desulfobacteraceae bacterium]|jgi:hypothetical protein|nr:hypothetical protein [Desulfobacteraceae bacterium]